MTKEECKKLFLLLSGFWPNAKQLANQNTQYAWYVALEPYAYEPVRKAVIEYARKNKFFPDLADITADLPAPLGEFEKEAIRKIMERRGGGT